MYENLAKVFLPARWLSACEFVGSGVKMARMVRNGRDLIGWLGPKGASMSYGTWIDATDQDQHGACRAGIYSLASGSVRKCSVCLSSALCMRAGRQA